MKSYRFGLGFLAIGLFITGCATSPTEKLVDRELQAEPAVHSQADLQKEFDTDISLSSFRPDQKQKLADLRKTVGSDLEKLRSQSLKLRSVLIHALLKKDYNPREVSLIEKDYKKVEEARVALLFKAVQDTDEILERIPTKEAEVFMNQMFLQDQMRNY